MRRRGCEAARFLTPYANFFRINFDALSERAEVIAAVASRLDSHMPAGLPGERIECLRCDARISGATTAYRSKA
jgi:hypothetical protein